MNMMKHLINDEAGSPTVESIFWIVIFIGVIIVAVTVFAGKVEDAMSLQGDNLLAKSYDTYCASQHAGEGKYVWDRETDKVAFEAGTLTTPTCKVAA